VVIAAPPSLAGAVKVTVACEWPPMAMTAVGAPGAVAAIAPGAKHKLSKPMALIASRRSDCLKRRADLALRPRVLVNGPVMASLIVLLSQCQFLAN
jgi:hypothetical protein